MSDPINELRGIIPLAYVPPFLRNQFVAEQVVEVRRVHVGTYDPRLIPNCWASYRDRTLDKEIALHFHDGKIWKEEFTQ